MSTIWNLLHDRGSSMKFLARSRFVFVMVLGSLAAASPLLGQVPPDQAAAMMLNSARKAYGEKNYPFAATRFREFLSKFGGHKEAAAARYGLALALLESPEKNYNEARDLLQGLASSKDNPDLPFILYHLG